MLVKNEELVSIVNKFALSGWVGIDAPSKEWLDALKNGKDLKTATINLVNAI